MVPVRAALIVNPAARAAEAGVAAVQSAAARLGWQPPLLLPTTVEHPGGQQTIEALDAGVDRLIVAGGDGTLRQVAAAVASHPNSATIPIAVIPVGAGNLVARNLGVHPRRLAEAAAVAHSGVVSPLSVGWVSCQVAGVWQPEVVMLMATGLGRDAQAVAAVRPWLKRQAGWLAYAEAGGRHAFHPAMPMTISLDGGPANKVLAWSVLVGGLPRLPMGVVAFPGATVGADMAQVLHVHVHHPLEWLPVAVKGLAHTTADVAALNYWTASDVVVRPDRPAVVQIDGDVVADVQQLRVRWQPKAVTVLRPRL